MPEGAFSIGERTGSRFRESVESQLEAIANKLGVRTASVSTGSAYLQTDSGRNLDFENL
jgi:hypothetical protein